MGRPLAKIPRSEETAALEALAFNGVCEEHFERLRLDPDYARRIAFFMRCGGIVPALDHATAKAILGSHYFGVIEWEKHFRIPYNDDERFEVFDCFPWGRDVLEGPCPFTPEKKVWETHFAFLGLPQLLDPLTMRYWSRVYPDRVRPSEAAVWTSNSFLQVTCGFRWYLMPLVALQHRGGLLSYEEWVAQIPVQYEMAWAVEELTMALLYHMMTGRVPVQDARVRCRDGREGPDGGPALAMGFGEDGIVIFQDTLCLNFGIALSRKLPLIA